MLAVTKTAPVPIFPRPVPEDNPAAPVLRPPTLVTERPLYPAPYPALKPAPEADPEPEPPRLY